MKSVYDILEQVAKTSSRNEKEAILKANEGNNLLKRVIFLANDPFTLFWIKKIPSAQSLPDGKRSMNLEEGLNELADLSTRKKTGNAGIEHLSLILANVSENDASIIERVVQKDLKCGFTEGTANKIWPKLVKEYPCMLCERIKFIKKITYPAIAQLKEDGMRFNAQVIWNDAKATITYLSRNGKILNLFNKFDDAFIHMSDGDDLVFDGELLVADEKGVPLPRQTGNGILSKANKGTISREEVVKVVVSLWDIIPLDLFEGKQKTSILSKYVDRFDNLKKRWASGKVKDVLIVESTVVKSLDEANELYIDYLSKGYEGIILKNMNGYWEDKRTQNQIKFKAELECDLKCVAIEMGTKGSKNEGLIGALLLESADGIIHTGCGSGLKDFHRAMKHEEFLDKIINVKYNARIKDSKSGQESLFLPIFLSVRDDKNVADNSKDIK